MSVVAKVNKIRSLVVCWRFTEFDFSRNPCRFRAQISPSKVLDLLHTCISHYVVMSALEISVINDNVMSDRP